MNEFYRTLRKVAEQKYPGKHGGIGYQIIAQQLHIGSDEIKAIFTQHLKGAKRPNIVHLAKVVEFLGLGRCAIAQLYAAEPDEVAAEQAPSSNNEMGAKEWVNPNPKKYSVGMLCQVLAALGGEYLGNNAGLQQKITALDNDGNRKPISNGAFYRLIEQAEKRGLIEVNREITYKKDENGKQIGKGKIGDKLITLLPNWKDKLGDE
ncbi:FIG00639312: hypothetical protein [Escherichia coli O10:K5(L):H4 str. ATCC 23506]|nr:FIG00639312: hypothetical protein [Escherichia coli O10:K5(L):H4 str. ATCC 23506]STG91936.1 Uncharacterised protein [Escherichia coli]STJ66053.1 Uncharacterised protein [Escherichia coli]